MLKKTVTYVDIDDITRTEDFYFNMTKAEVIELQVSRAGGFAESLKFLVESRDQKQILSVIKELLLKAYGERTDVSRRFDKRPEYAEAFSHTEAFSVIFMELFEGEAKAAAFFEALMPADLVKASRAEQGESPQNTPGRRAPQDYQQKVVPAFSTVKDVLVADDLPLPEKAVHTFDRDPEQNSISRTDFLELSSTDAEAFVRMGGRIL